MNYLRNIFYKILSLILIKNIKNYKNIAYYNHFGFGDTIFFFLLFKLKKIKYKKKIFCFTQNQLNIANFFINKKNIKKSKILLPEIFTNKFLSENLLKSKYFKPYKVNNFEYSITQSLKIKNICERSIKNYLVSKNIHNCTKKKYVCLFVKHYHFDEKKIVPSIRNTSNLNKIEKLIIYLQNKGFVVIVLGKNRDKFPNYLKKKIKNSDLIYLNEYSKNYSIHDQFYLAKKCSFYLGSASGASIPYFLLQKKIIHFDTTKHQYDSRAKNIQWLYKRIKIKNKFYILKTNSLKFNKKKSLQLKENSYDEIVNKVKSLI